jgi:hypothetical protein
MIDKIHFFFYRISFQELSGCLNKLADSFEAQVFEKLYNELKVRSEISKQTKKLYLAN